MKFFNLLIFSVLATIQAKVLNFTQYEREWVKGKKYDIQYTYLEEPTFSKFKINIYNQTNSVTIDEIKTDDFSKMDIHTITLEYPKVQTGKYKIVGLDDKNNAISNDFSVKLVLKASTKTTSAPTPIATATKITNELGKNNENENKDNNIWKTIAIIVSIIVVLLLFSIIGLLIYKRYKKNKKYEEEVNSSIWKVPVTERSFNINRGLNAYSVPNASVTERDLSFSSDVDGYYSYGPQYKNPEYTSPRVGYSKERNENTKSIYSYTTNVTKVSNNILDILYPSNEKKEKEKSVHEKSELSIDLGHLHSQKDGSPRRKKHSDDINNGQRKGVSSKSSERVRTNSEVRGRSNSFKNNALNNRKSRVSLADSESSGILNKKSKVSIVENEKNSHTINNSLLDESTGDISLNNINNNNSDLALPLSSKRSPGALKSISALNNDKNFNVAALNPDTPEYYIKNIKLNKKYTAICNFKPSLIDEMNVNKNDVIVIHEVFTDGWGLGKNLNSEKEGLLPLNCLNI
ncbi:hypothetical protein H8356DRAFT_1308868 [Neocallimastix lanati (nom. inval.)]|jgi:hypothetical protein|uniref:SH3 domain-containing protein n=1 Tax=Neocallimastix californiae TaxID=1754190 RepID=A0A1Y2AD30_9FUNG|nr:hypothetical protein H8356DRAFT_1308868 [Neocallimastix sp. JGI-2020a]ORY20177.1 hypothetical protein LY90DRAFT_676888 [Neocallimastix californiae]|eukprot:ORY20177.1 hypothetical protein LY90DRAFT_676888 [Neocallimastix californiae]